VNKRVAILGAGPAGLAAAHAAYLAGAWVHIFSRGDKSPLYGCQYLHAPLPEIKAEQRTVSYQLWGTAKEYREKVYGDAWRGEVSVSELAGTHEAWDIRATYDRLWELYVESRGRAAFSKSNIDARWLDEFIRKYTGFFSHVISTIPAPSICAFMPKHTFFGQDIWAVGEAADRGQVAPVTCPPDSIICNGQEAPAWYRISNVFGATTVEWPSQRKPPIPYVARVSKPLYTDCYCFPGIIRMGRYGAWKKDQLTHHVFEQTTELLSANSPAVSLPVPSDD
jgi:hypothetical protein